MIDKPLEFAGAAEFRAGGAGVLGAQDVMLRGLAAGSCSLDDAARTLTLRDGDAALDTIRFSNVPTLAPFGRGPAQSCSSPLHGAAGAAPVVPFGHCAEQKTFQSTKTHF